MSEGEQTIIPPTEQVSQGQAFLGALGTGLKSAFEYSKTPEGQAKIIRGTSVSASMGGFTTHGRSEVFAKSLLHQEFDPHNVALLNKPIKLPMQHMSNPEYKQWGVDTELSSNQIGSGLLYLTIHPQVANIEMLPDPRNIMIHLETLDDTGEVTSTSEMYQAVKWSQDTDESGKPLSDTIRGKTLIPISYDQFLSEKVKDIRFKIENE